ncbi:MAG: putative exported protein [Betaproteobacteria bacterium]|nr:putative exported protein [Betaproteobacteria bacterium]
MRSTFIAAALLAIIIAPLTAHGQRSDYPTKSIRFIVPVTTGGPSDLVARLLAEKLSTAFGKQVIVDNRPGASNTVGAAMVAKAEPDGYTLLEAAANMATNPILMNDLPFDVVKDFTPISLTHLTPYVIVVSSQSPVKSVPELLKFIKDNQGKVNYGTTGVGSPQQLATLLFSQVAGGLGTMAEISYKGSSAAHPDLIANRISFMIDPLAAAGPHIKAGFLRGLAVTTSQRNPAFPDVPTAIEAGVAGYDFSSWGGVFAPAGTPRAVVQKLNKEIVAALGSQDLTKRFGDMGLIAKSSTPEEFAKFLQAEIERWGAVLKKKP